MQPDIEFGHGTMTALITLSIARQRIRPIGRAQEGHLFLSLLQHVGQAICPLSH